MSELLTKLRNSIHQLLDLTLGHPSSVAYLGFPNHSNVGDSMIWLGTQQYLKDKHIQVLFTADKRTYGKATLTSLIGDGTILLHGGGNFGDLWPDHHALRMQILQDFPRTKIVSLPQTTYFQTQQSLDSTRRIVDTHQHLILLARDSTSFDFMTRYFQCPVHLCPDTALLLCPTAQLNSPSEVLCLLRQDKETTFHSLPHASFPYVKKDWIEEPLDLLIAFGKYFNLCMESPLRNLPSARRLLSYTYDQMALSRFHRGIKTLISARVVITDRLHVHILCLLLRKAHCILDNNYGKNRQFYDTWTNTERSAHWCDTIGDAFEMASEIMESDRR